MKNIIFILFLIQVNSLYGQFILEESNINNVKTSQIESIQTGYNILTLTEFESIQVCGVDPKFIIDSKGNPTIMEKLFGTPLSKNIDPEGGFNHYKFSGFDINFSAVINPEMELSGFRISDTSGDIRIKGTSIKIGDNIDKLGYIKYNLDTNGDYSIIYSTCEGCDSLIVIDFEQTSKLVTKIYLLVLN